jgi:hypothetical protein
MRAVEMNLVPAHGAQDFANNTENGEKHVS